MKDVKFAWFLALLLTAVLLVVVHTRSRLDPAVVITKVSIEDESDREGAFNESILPGNDDADEPTHAVTVANVDELAVTDPRIDGLLAKAEKYLGDNSTKFTNHNYLTVVDFSRPSSQTRMFVKDLRSGLVLGYHVAHGSGSDPKNTGKATIFSNAVGSNASSVGFFRVGETYQGKHGISARLDGLSPTNSNVRKRGVVIHGAKYVYEADKKTGRSWGCFAVSETQYQDVVTMLKGGSLLYAESN